MAQQLKKKNVAALSYFSLHEKLGEANRKNRELEKDFEELSDYHRYAVQESFDLNNKYTDLKLKYNSMIVGHRCALATSIVLNIALLLFTIL